jgi:hypothetical protein
LFLKETQFDDDLTREARVETLIIPAGATTSEAIDSLCELSEDYGYETDDVEHLEQVGEAAYQLEIKAITFDGDSYHELQSDDQEHEYTAPQWYDEDGNNDAADINKGERNYAVAFTRNTKPKIGATFRLVGSNAPALWGSNGGVGTVKLRAHGSDGIEIPATSAEIDEDYVTLPVTESSTPLPDMIKYYNKEDEGAFILTWEISFDSGATWIELGATKHSVYVVLSDPVTDLNQESLFAISCRETEGMSGDPTDPTVRDSITEEIWSGFVNRTVERVDGSTLFYYQSYSTGNFTTESLLASGDGQCGAWTKLFLDTRKVQGLSDADAWVTFIPTNPTGVPPEQKGFVVKDWVFSSSGHSGDASFPFLNLPDNPFQTDSYHWRGNSEVNDASTGLIGQGPRINPASYFNNHQMAYINSKYYDASYGDKHTTISDVQAALSGFWIEKQFYLVQESVVDLDLDGDGSKTGVVGVPVTLFSQDTSAPNLTQIPRPY